MVVWLFIGLGISFVAIFAAVWVWGHRTNDETERRSKTASVFTFVGGDGGCGGGDGGGGG